MYIGANDAATAQAKLHVGGTLMADGAVTAKNGMNVTGNTTITGNTSVTGNMAVSSSFTVGANITATAGTVTATNFVGYGTIPLGGIIMWSGTTIPDGWALCNGQSSNGYKTPDLRGRFVIGYGAGFTDYGSGTVSANVWDNTYNQPGNLSQKGTTTGNTGGEKTHTLIVDEIPSHHHGTGADVYVGNRTTDDSGGLQSYFTGIRPDWSATYKANWTDNTGGSQPHENRPPYYVLAFIMRVK
jgi:microcystin-dependent protein